ncbi:MAG: hypothetical protein ACLPXT_02280 [Terracidiphilus sp.]
MHIHKFWLTIPLLGAALSFPVCAQVPTITVATTINPGVPLSVTGTASATLSIFSQKAGVACSDAGFFDLGNPLSIQEGTGTPGPSIKLTGSVQSITLSTPAQAGDTLCLRAFNGSSSPGYAPITVVSPAMKIAFVAKPVAGSNAISIQGDPNAKVGVLQLPASYVPNPKSDNCSQADIPNGQLLAIGLQNPTTNSIVLVDNKPLTVPLNKPLQVGIQLCLVAQETAVGGGVTYDFSPFATVQAAATSTQRPSINGTLESGANFKTISVYGVDGASIEVFAFDLTDQTNNSVDCETLIKNRTKPGTIGTQLQIAPGGTSSSPSNSVTLGKTGSPYSITLNNALNAYTQICLQQTVTPASGTSTVQQSQYPTPVNDSNNPYPRMRTFYTAGVLINNQYNSNGSGSSSSSSSSSSSAGTAYLDFGMAFLPWIESTKRVGFNTSISGRFSAIPVAAPSASSSSSSNNGTLNILSSQESARVLGSAYVPLPNTNVFSGNYAFFTAPLIKAGFTTLLNPSATSTNSSGTAAANFAPVYWQYSSGLRVGYRQYPIANKDSKDQPTPRTIAQVDITIGKYSNLQSYVCGTQSTTVTSATAPANTSCYTTVTAPNPSSTPPTLGTYTLYAQDRTNLYRMEVEGFFLFPGTPFVVGIDANLPQSALAPRNLDILNKAPGNVAVYFGVSGSLTSLFNKIAGASQ